MQHRDKIYGYFLSRLRDPETASDLAQDVFLAAARALPTLQGDRPLLPWLYAVAHRRYVDEVRRRRREDDRVPFEEATVESILGSVLDAPATEVVTDAVRALPPGQRSVCVLRLFQGLAFTEIRDQLNVPEPACRARFHRALITLRRELESVEDAIEA